MVEPKNQILPAYEEYKRIILFDFQILKEYSSKIRVSRNRANTKELLIHYKEAYQNFYQDINDSNKLDQLDEKQKERMIKMYNNLNKISQKNVHLLTSLCRELVFKMGITKIEYKSKNPSDAMKTGNTR